MKYLDRGMTLEVAEDWLSPGTWCSWHRTDSGAAYRARTKELPDRKSREEAQRDLDAYARKYHFAEVEE